MLMRFTLPFIHAHTNRPVGVFRGAYWVYQEGLLHEAEVAWLFDEIDWFNHNLPAPWSVDPRAVFWFRPSAGAPLSRIWTVVRILEDNGEPVHVYRTRRPGIVVYEDQYQVAAVPWRDTFATRVHSHA
jgi:hypothetical protein